MQYAIQKNAPQSRAQIVIVDLADEDVQILDVSPSVHGLISRVDVQPTSSGGDAVGLQAAWWMAIVVVRM